MTFFSKNNLEKIYKKFLVDDFEKEIQLINKTKQAVFTKMNEELEVFKKMFLFYSNNAN